MATYEGHRDAHSLVFGGYDVSNDFQQVTVRRCLAPEIDVSYDEPPGISGAIINGVRLGPLEVECVCRLGNFDAYDLAELRHRLAAVLFSTEPRPLVLPDDPDKYHLAVLSGKTDLDRLYVYPEVTLTFFCADPVAYGRARVAEVGDDATRLIAGGTFRALPTVTATPPKTSGSWTVENETTGEYVEVLGGFDGTETVVVDMAAQRTTVDGTARAVSLESDYFSISGNCELSVSEGEAVVEWRERWL